MSLEQLITDNTAAIRELTAAILANVASKPAAVKADEKKPAAASSQNGAKDETKSKADDKPAATVIDYAQVRELILAAAKAVPREKMVALMGRFGVKSGKDLKPEVYGEFSDKTNAMIAGTYDPEAGEAATADDFS